MKSSSRSGRRTAMGEDLVADICSDCPVPPLPGDPQPPTRCTPCPYHGYVRVRHQREDGRWETNYVQEPDPNAR